MLDANSLKKCQEVISSLRENKPLWIPKNHFLHELSFFGKMDRNTNHSVSYIYPFIQTHSEFEEYMIIVKKTISACVDDSELEYCNAIWEEIIHDKYIRKSFCDANFSFEVSIQPVRYARYVVLKRLMELSKRSEGRDYWRAIYDFTEEEVNTFDNGYLKFHEKVISIMYGYVSGELRSAYATGVEAINRYKEILCDLLSVEKELVFKYLFDKDESTVKDIEWELVTANEISDILITNRNDETLSERAFVTELLKLYINYSDSSKGCVSLVYRFTRSSFIANDIERKTIQRCWESLCKAIRDGKHAHDRYLKLVSESDLGAK